MNTACLKAASLGVLALAATAAPAFAQSADWPREVNHILSSRQTYPPLAQMRGEEGTAKVRVYVGADGSVQRTEIVTTSGSSTLDKEALALPQKVHAVPAPPMGATSVTVTFTWKLI